MDNLFIVLYGALCFSSDGHNTQIGKRNIYDDVAYLPITKRLSAVVSWRSISVDQLMTLTDELECQALVSELMDSIISLRDDLAIEERRYGVFRAYDPISFLLIGRGNLLRNWLQGRQVTLPLKPSAKLLNVLHYDRLSSKPAHRDAKRLFALAEASGERLNSVVQYTNLFENAFRESHERKLQRRLELYLSPTPYKVTEQEIKSWWIMRGMNAHSPRVIEDFDLPKYDLPLVRIKQAAFDVAFNKKNWGNKDIVRTDRSHLTCWVMSDGTYEALAHTKIQFSLHRDQFGTFIDQTLIDREMRAEVNQAFRLCDAPFNALTRDLFFCRIYQDDQKSGLKFSMWRQ